ncbi:MAG: DUF885 domain-containing protein [Bdellovibrionales bacterium]|nr:DUF885 domain-containing protein [Bdellovibrionales bacterium]
MLQLRTLSQKLAPAFATLICLSCSSPTKPAGTLGSSDKVVMNFFEASFQASVRRHPEFATYLGKKDRYSEWDDHSEEFLKKEIAIVQEELRLSTQFDPTQLSEETRTSLALFQKMQRDFLEDSRWRFHDYYVNQMFGTHSNIAWLLMDQHSITTLSDAEAYIQRVINTQTVIKQTLDMLREQEKRGISYPKFVYPKVIEDMKNLTNGIPFLSSKKTAPSPLWENFSNKIEKAATQDPTAFSSETKAALLEKLKLALNGPFNESFTALSNELARLSKKAKTTNGAWALPQGEEYYRYQVGRATTTKLSPEQIHQIGLNEVKRIHSEMSDVMKAVQFEGNRKDFFHRIKKDPAFTYPNSAEGRAQIVKDTENLIKEVQEKTKTYFTRVPESLVEVKPVEPYRERSAGKAFYNGPSEDGTRPGIYYLNLSDMKALPKIEIPALTYHETIPGHHFQIAFAQTLKALPEFRRYLSFTAYVEGWGLYAERIPVEMGLYKDPYVNFGRLSMELWRACRLVVDTGIHSKRWSREKAIQYLMDNTPTDIGEATKSIERYFVMPGQATAYMVGMLKFVELKSLAQAKLGSRFQVAAFHDEVLKHGALPLDILESKVREWISRQPPVTAL